MTATKIRLVTSVLTLFAACSAMAFQWEYLGMDGVSATCIEVDPVHQRVLVGTREGFHIYDQETGVWTERDDEGWIGRQVHAIQWDPDLDQRLVTGRENAFWKGYLELTDDLGETGGLVHMSQGGRFVDLLHTGSHVYACGISDITPGELLQSADRGETWSPLLGHGHTAMTGLAEGPSGDLYVCGDGGVSVSWDLGDTWESATVDLPAGLVRCILATNLGGDAIEHSVLAGMDQGLYYAYWPGTPWQQVLATGCREVTMAHAPAPWPIGRVIRLAIVTVDDQVLYQSGWIDNYTDETGDLPGTPVDIAFSSWDRGLYVCTAQHGVYRVQGVITGIEETPASASPTLRAWPNPFNPRTHLRFTVPEEGTVNLAVYDLAGRQVARLQDGWLPEGRHEMDWNPAGIPSGVYLARLVTSQGESTVELVLLR